MKTKLKSIETFKSEKMNSVIDLPSGLIGGALETTWSYGQATTDSYNCQDYQTVIHHEDGSVENTTDHWEYNAHMNGSMWP